jgi:hypothetical protein
MFLCKARKKLSGYRMPELRQFSFPTDKSFAKEKEDATGSEAKFRTGVLLVPNSLIPNVRKLSS